MGPRTPHSHALHDARHPPCTGNPAAAMIGRPGEPFTLARSSFTLGVRRGSGESVPRLQLDRTPGRWRSSLIWGSQYGVSGPVARAVESCAPEASLSRRRSAAEVLAGMLDLPSSVRLSDWLAPEKVTPAADLSWRTPLLLGDYVQKRLTAIDELTSRRLARPFDGARVRVSSATDLAAELAANGSDARAFVNATWESYRVYLLVNVARARAEIAALRDEIGQDLKEASAHGAKLEAVDAVVRGALAADVPSFLERLANAMEAPFVTRLAAAVDALAAVGGAIDAAALGPWFDPRGVLGEQLARTHEITRALLRREARILVTLVQAACAGAGRGTEGRVLA
jgi:hypothetical protein